MNKTLNPTLALFALPAASINAGVISVISSFTGSNGEDGKWVLSRTYQGIPTREVCIRCHPSPTQPGVFTPLLEMILKSRADLEKVSYKSQTAKGLAEAFTH